MGLKNEPSSEPLHSSAEKLFFNHLNPKIGARIEGAFFPTLSIGPFRRVDVRLLGKGNSNAHGARPLHLIITMIVDLDQ